MRITFGDSVLNDIDSWQGLRRVFDLIEDYRHTINPSHNLKSLLERKWLESASESDQAWIGDVISHSMRYSYSSSEIDVTIEKTKGQSQATLTIAEAIKSLNKPVYVVLENSGNDGGFLKAVAKALNISEFSIAVSNGWIELIHGGGITGIPSRTVQILSQNIPGPIRIFILTDSDRRFPEDDISPGAESVKNFATKENVRHAVLKKRAVDNYLPLKTIEVNFDTTKPEAERFLRAFATLNDLQKDYFPIKNGFKAEVPSERRKEAHPKYIELYSSLNKDTVKHLRKPGFSAKAITWFSNSDEAIKSGGLRDNDEIKKIIQQILELS